MSTIKFLHLQIGQQFELRGEHYTKVTPLIASNNADGKQKMIPRSTLVRAQHGENTTAETQHHDQHPALAILERYHQTAVAELKSLTDDEAKLGASRSRLKALRDELAQAIQQR
ncbi:MAG: hypothetical protein ABFS08_12675 [Pseudomonadota bacterium]